jgi:hypothetical protein
MRRYLQQGRGQLVGDRVWFAALSAVATAVYLLTMDRSASWWDCGEFIATSWQLGVGHPPGAPLYQLVTHVAMLLSFGNTMLVAPLSNAVSAVCGGLTVGLLYLTIVELVSPFTFHLSPRFGAAVAALCYLFCDTAWFSAVESEVYAMAMLFCALDVWVALRWCRTRNGRLLPLLALLLGLGVCVHLMTLLVVPTLALVVLSGCKVWPLAKRLPVYAAFFLLGLTPYAIVPLRAAANPPINEGNPSTVEGFRKYVGREQYAKAPLYPRIWRERDSAYTAYWSGGHEGLLGNAIYYGSYQLGYMYGRYLMYNFIGRENLKTGRVVLFVLPMLLALWGLLCHRRRERRGYWTVMLLFLFGGVVLNFYLNHPCYEPRERDYAYVLSFYAVALWIGIGAADLAERLKGWRWLLLLAPLSMAAGNWSDHDRSRCHAVHDIALNHLQSCDTDAILITLGDNDTFPLWYLQQVEGRRTDVSVYNLGLTGYGNLMRILDDNAYRRPVYVSQYFYYRYGWLYEGRLRCEGFCWRMLPGKEGVDDREPLLRHVQDSIEWHITQAEYKDRVTRSFLRDWEETTGLKVELK